MFHVVHGDDDENVTFENLMSTKKLDHKRRNTILEWKRMEEKRVCRECLKYFSTIFYEFICQGNVNFLQIFTARPQGWVVRKGV